MKKLIHTLEIHGRRGLKLLAADGYHDAKTFIARTARSGVEVSDFVEILREHQAADFGVEDSEAQLRLIERVALEKMWREKKSRWGLKCSDDFEAYLALWPQAYFINVVRDGRDVLASQQNTGNFKLSAQEVGKMWANTHTKFRRLVENPSIRAHEIVYENLANDPEKEVRGLCEFLEVDFVEDLLRFHQKDLSIYRNPRGHLSIDRISRPIDGSKIGRWKEDLSTNDLDHFMAEAGPTMKLLGYI